MGLHCLLCLFVCLFVFFSAAPAAPSMLTSEEMDEAEVAYLPIIGTGPPTDPAAAQPDLSRCVHSMCVGVGVT